MKGIIAHSTFESQQKWNLKGKALQYASLILTQFESQQKWNLKEYDYEKYALKIDDLNLSRLEAIERPYMDAGTAA